MAALHLLPRLGGRSILLCERGERFGRGVAYGTDDAAHLLNVRAGNMSAFPAVPDIRGQAVQLASEVALALG